MNFFIKLFLILGLLMFTRCQKKSAPPVETISNTSIKVSLSSDKNSIRLGQEAVITASVSGGEGTLSYSWKVNTIANLLGSGNTVTFSPCCSSVAGDNMIECTVTDSKGNKGTGQINILVNP